ncbi:MAG: hypothetical protein ACXADU_12960 [Promethearchaeota archaeon]|jgi:hypothetical protein
MQQILVKDDARIELEELHIILKEKIAEYYAEEQAIAAEKLYKMFENINPKYHESLISLKGARSKIAVSDIIYSNKFYLDRAY